MTKHGSMYQRTAHAKINLSLHVTGQRNDGYHLLDSIVVFTEFGDQITLKPSPKASEPITLEITGPFAKSLTNDDGNLVLVAATLLADALMEVGVSPNPVSLVLDKQLPVASGIGGGSADAAATLLLLKDYWAPDRDFDLYTLALTLGADVPMCLHSYPLRAQGIGEKINLLETDQIFNLVLANPGKSVSTPDVFRKLNHRENPPCFSSFITAMPDIETVTRLRNDLAEPAQTIQSEISNVMEALRSTPDCILARMSGSGATCFGIYETPDQAKAACAQVQSSHPNWWCVATPTTVE